MPWSPDTVGMVVAVVVLCGLVLSNLLPANNGQPSSSANSIPKTKTTTTTSPHNNNNAEQCGFSTADLPESIYWAAPFYSGGGYCSEARDAADGLESCGVGVWRLQHGDGYNHAFTQRLGGNRLAALQAKTVRALPNAKPPQGAPPTICVCHSEPGAWSAPRPNYRTGDCPARGCSYTIGRTMFETDRIPDGWAGRLNFMDEIWVPTEFQRRIFATHGVAPSKLHVVGETVDSQFFDPATAKPFDIPQRLMEQAGAVRGSGSPPLSDKTVVFFRFVLCTVPRQRLVLGVVHTQ